VYGTASASHINELIKLNNKTLRILQFRNNRLHVGELYKFFSTAPIFKLRVIQVAAFVHKVIHHPTELHIIFWNNFVFNAEFYICNTRHEQNVHVHPIQIAYGQRMIRYS
jgi:hypothetical protein